MRTRLHRLAGTCIASGLAGILVMAGNPAIAADGGKAAGMAESHAMAREKSGSAPFILAQADPHATTPTGDLAQRIEEGKKIAFDRSKGNCLACHALPGGDMPGNIGPKLPYPGMTMKQRFPDRAKLRAQIFNAAANNPNTVMPPFGKNRILTEDELEKVTDYIWSL